MATEALRISIEVIEQHQDELRMLLPLSNLNVYNLGQNIADKFSKLNLTGFL